MIVIAPATTEGAVENKTRSKILIPAHLSRRDTVHNGQNFFVLFHAQGVETIIGAGCA
jgi:ribosomal protein S19